MAPERLDHLPRPEVATPLLRAIDGHYFQQDAATHKGNRSCDQPGVPPKSFNLCAPPILQMRARPRRDQREIKDVRRLDVSMKDLLSAAQREASHITRYLPFETHLLMVSTMINLGTYPFGTFHA